MVLLHYIFASDVQKFISKADRSKISIYQTYATIFYNLASSSNDHGNNKKSVYN